MGNRLGLIYTSGFFVGTNWMIYYCYRTDDMHPIFTSYAAILSGAMWPISIPVLYLCSKHYKPLN